MFFIILYQPQIPQNTGNIIRLCHNVGAHLCLIHPLGFVLSDKHLKRSGMDYINDVKIDEFLNLDECIKKMNFQSIYLLSSQAELRYDQTFFEPQDAFLFGSENFGVDSFARDMIPKKQQLTIPMRSSSRCLNLSNSVSIVLYEAWRQNAFK